MGLRGHIGKILQLVAVAALCLAAAGVVEAASVQMANPSTSGTYDLSANSTWTGTPTNGTDVFINFTSSWYWAAARTLRFSPTRLSNVFVADSLSPSPTQAGGNQSDSLLIGHV